MTNCTVSYVSIYGTIVFAGEQKLTGKITARINFQVLKQTIVDFVSDSLETVGYFYGLKFETSSRECV